MGREVQIQIADEHRLMAQILQREGIIEEDAVEFRLDRRHEDVLPQVQEQPH